MWNIAGGTLCGQRDAGKDGDDNLLAEALSHERTEGLPGAVTYRSENYGYVTLSEADDDQQLRRRFVQQQQRVFQHVVAKKRIVC